MTADEAQVKGSHRSAAEDSLLTPFLAKLASFLAACPDDDRSVSVSLGKSSFAMNAWERRAAFHALSHQGGDVEPWERTVAEGAALRLALMRSLAGLHAATPGGAIAAEEELASAVAAGSSITDALKMQAEHAHAAGEAELARHLVAFRDRLAEALSQGWQAISGAELAWEPVADLPPPDTAPLPTEVPAEVSDGVSAPAAESAGDQAPPVDVEHESLEPLLARAAAFLRIRAAEDRSLEIRFGRRCLKLSLWERRLLWRLLVERREPAHEWHRPIVDVIALQLAILPQLEELERRQADSEELQPIAQEVAKHLRVAAPLVEDLRVTIEKLIASGQAQGSRHLTAFRNAFADTVRAARSALLELAARESGGAAGVGTANDKPSLSRLAGIDPDLEPYYERAGGLLRMRGHEEKPVSISIGSRAWHFTTWERGILWKTLCQEGVPGAAWVLLMAKCAVLQLAVLLELEKLRQLTGDKSAREHSKRVLADLVERARLTLEDLRAVAESLDKDGQDEVASLLMELSTKISGTLQAARVSG